MQILYGTAMAAIFVLCVVLLWTARRILRSSPLTSGEFSLAGAQAPTYESDFSTETDYAEIAQFDLEPEVAEISTSLIDPIALEMMASANSVANEPMAAPIAAQIQEPMQAAMETPAPPMTEVLVEAADVVAEPEAKRGGRFTKHLPHGYNYMLEGLLLGVSVFVLIRTQRSNWRYQRSLQSSDQVA
ncbi:MAG TPA: hypothetical protein VMF56_14045 [Acidobacteriaceae bacterium]|nr:hypothetical protein [Acidobacteriaceae bacterium]